MAKNDNDSIIIDRPEITFYLYRRKDNKLHMRETKIYSPFNVKTQGFETDKFDYFDVKYVTFNKGMFKLDVNTIGGEVLYDQAREFLSFYNNEGGKLTKGIDSDKSSKRNGMLYSGRGKPFFITQKAIEDKKTKEKETIKEVQVQTIPRIVAEGMDFTQLNALAKAWGVDIPEDIEDSQVPERIKEEYIKILSEHITD